MAEPDHHKPYNIDIDDDVHRVHGRDDKKNKDAKNPDDVLMHELHEKNRHDERKVQLNDGSWTDRPGQSDIFPVAMVVGIPQSVKALLQKQAVIQYVEAKFNLTLIGAWRFVRKCLNVLL